MRDIQKFRGCLIGGAAGDALGYPVEFMSIGGIVSRWGRHGIREYALTGGVAQISDDTQMTLFTAAGLLTGAARGELLLPAVANSYQDWLRTQTGERFSPGERPCAWLVNVPDLWSRRAPGNTCMGALLQGHPVEQSKGCGGVMRVAPVGLYLPGRPGCSQDEADLFAAQAAALTHGSDLAYLPAAMLAHMVGRLVYSETNPADAAEDALAAVERLFPETPHLRQFTALMEKAMTLARAGEKDLKAIDALGEGWYGDEALAISVFCALKYSDKLEKALTAAVNHSGDSDSTGAITGNILGAYLGLDAVPRKFTEDLELKDVILEVADDLYRAACGTVDPDGDSAWREKYVDAAYSGPGA